MEKINKGLCVSTVFFALLSLVLAGSAIHLFQKNGDLKEKAKNTSNCVFLLLLEVVMQAYSDVLREIRILIAKRHIIG